MIRNILVALVAALMAGPPTAIGDDGVFLFRYANAQNPNDPRSVSMVFFEEELEERSDGRAAVCREHGAVPPGASGSPEMDEE